MEKGIDAEILSISEDTSQNYANQKCIDLQSDKALPLDFPIDMTINKPIQLFVPQTVSLSVQNSYFNGDKNKPEEDPLDFSKDNGFSTVQINGQFDTSLQTKDFPYYGSSTFSINGSQVQEGLQYICYISDGPRIEPDLPEFVSLDDIEVAPEYKDYFETQSSKNVKFPVPLHLKRNRNCKPNVISVTPTVEGPVIIPTDDSDDDVIFVTMYSNTETTVTNTVTSAALKTETSTVSATAVTPAAGKVVRKRKKKKNLVVPRRNPKRVAQLEKASLALAMQLSVPSSIFNAKINRSAQKSCYSESLRNCRQSCRTTGAILCPPSPLSNKDWKEWPPHGHTFPVYNPESQTLNTEKEANSFSKRNDECSAFGVLMHESLHRGLSYVRAVQEFNKIVKNREAKTDGEATKNGITKTKNGLQENVMQACNLLVDLCRLYCVSNNVGEEFLAKYVDSLSHDNFIGEE